MAATTNPARPSPRTVPTAAALLGYAGLIPFVALSLAAFAPGWPGTFARAALPAYALAILSFMGGVHWGLAMAEREPTLPRLGASVLPVLAGWAAHLVGGTPGLLLTATAFAALLAYDLALVRRGAAPDWYPRLRWPLTATVVACLLLAVLVP